MTVTKDVGINLVLLSQQYLDGVKKVEGQTASAQKTLTKTFEKMERDAQGASAQYAALGDESKKLGQEQKAVSKAIDALTKAGFTKQSPQVQALIEDYRKLSDQSSKVELRNKTLGQTFASLRDVMQGPISAARSIVSAVKKIGAVIIDNVEEYTESEKAFNKLNSAFVASGDSSGVASRAIQAMADDLQYLTNISEEEIQSAAAMLKSINGLDKDGISKILPKIMDMSAQLGIDLKTATQQVAQTLSGGRNSLVKYGIEIDKNASSSEKLVAITEQLNAKFGGTAAALANVVDGIKLEAGELKEAIGGALLFNFGGLAEYYRDGIKTISDSIKSATKEAKIDNIVDTLMGGASFSDVGGQLKKVGIGWNTVLSELYGKQAKLSETISSGTFTDITGKVIRANDELLTQSRKDLQAINNKIEAVAAQAQAESQIAHATKESIKQAALDESAREKYIKSREIVVSTIGKEEEAINTLRGKIKELESTPWSKGSKLEEDRLSALAELNKQLEAEESAYWDKTHKEEKEAFEISQKIASDALERRSIAMNAYYAKLDKNKNANGESVSMLRDLLQAEGDAYSPEIVQKINEITDAMRNQESVCSKLESTISDMATIWGSASGAINAYMDLQSNQADAEIAALESSGASEEEISKKKNAIRKKEFNNTKTLNVVNTLMNTASAVAEALPDIPLSVTVGALGLIQSGIIAAQSYTPMADGGSGTVKKATHFIGGEAGEEDYIFAPKRMGGIEKSPEVKEIVERQIKERVKPLPMIAMADGGAGTVSSPTLFLAGEVPGVSEDYSFTPQNKESSRVVHNHFHYHIAGSVIRESEIGMLGANQIARATRGY